MPGNRRSAILCKDVVGAYGVDVLGVEQKSVHIKDEGSERREAIFGNVVVRASEEVKGSPESIDYPGKIRNSSCAMEQMTQVSCGYEHRGQSSRIKDPFDASLGIYLPVLRRHDCVRRRQLR